MAHGPDETGSYSTLVVDRQRRRLKVCELLQPSPGVQQRCLPACFAVGQAMDQPPGVADHL